MNVPRLNLFFLALSFCIKLSCFGQTESDLLSFKSTYKYNPYVFYDLFREAGIGCEFRDELRFSMDLRIGYIMPAISPLKTLDVNDYFLMRGIDISLFPKWELKNKTNNYFGFWASFQSSGYSDRIVKDRYNNMGTFNVKNSPMLSNESSNSVIRSRKSSLFIVGLTYSIKFTFNSLNIEPFVNFGCGFVASTSTVSGIAFSEPYAYTFHYPTPYVEHNQKLGGSANLGLKLGIGLRKSKKIEKYTDVINELNVDIANLRKIVEDLRKNHQLSEIAYGYFNERINEIKILNKKLIVSDKEPTEVSFKSDEKLVLLISYLKIHSFKKDAYVTPIIYKKPNGKTITLTTYTFDLFELKERITNYYDLTLSEDEKEKLFSPFYSN